VKITSLNLQGFETWEERKPHILAYLREESPDIVLFQEVVYLPELSAHNPAQLLNAELGYRYENCAVSRLQVGLEYPVYREGLAAISRYPILQSDVIVLKQAEGDEHQRVIQLLDILVNDEVIKIANVHFSITDFTDFATPQLEETLEILRARGEDRIIAGDFNLDHLEDLADLWQDRYEASTTFPYLSYPSWNKRNDYFLVPKKYTLANVTTSDVEIELSDHTALTAVITTPGHGGDWRDHLRKRLTQVRHP
jgi:endonuclease/exonuclease/phosphatase family metal-dependent hydrolase